MTEPLVKQIVDLKEEHTLMLEVLKKFANRDYWFVSLHPDYGYPESREWIGMDDKPWEMAEAVVKHVEIGNERRKAVGNVDLPDRRGMK